MQTVTINFGWQTFKETYEVACIECSSKLTRTISTGCNLTADKEYLSKLKEELRKEAEALIIKGEICTRCQIIKLPVKSEPAPLDDEWLRIIVDAEDRLNKAYNDAHSLARALSEKLRGKVAIYNGEEWLVSNISTYYDDGFRAYLYRINKRKPWETTNIQETIPLKDLLFTDEIFENRKKALKNGIL